MEEVQIECPQSCPSQQIALQGERWFQLLETKSHVLLPQVQGPLGGMLQDVLLNKFFPLDLLICSDFCLAPAEVSLQGAHPAAAGMWLHLACLSPCCWLLLWDDNNTGSRP